jgi:hypothetical protein
LDHLPCWLSPMLQHLPIFILLRKLRVQAPSLSCTCVAGFSDQGSRLQWHRAKELRAASQADTLRVVVSTEVLAQRTESSASANVKT